MLTIDQVNDMSSEQARLHFGACCSQLFGNQWQKPFCRETDTDPSTVRRWMQEDARPPVWAIRLADTLSHAREIESGLLALDSALTNIKALRQTL
jgi:hypothetical protein